MMLPLEVIDVLDERIREGVGEHFDEFKDSIRKFGQLQAIRVEKNGERYHLIAGYRRFCAIKALHEDGVAITGIPSGHIEATERDPVPVYQKLLHEFAENNDRLDFNYVEKAKFIRKFHETMQQEYGADAWTQELTAKTLNLSTAGISMYLRIEQEVKNDPVVAKAETLRAAMKRIKVNDTIKARVKEAKRDEGNSYTRANELLSLGDCKSWITNVETESVDLVNFDPPWGDETSHKSAENHEAFEDSTEYSESLIKVLLPELYRVLKPNRFCIFWYRAWAAEHFANLVADFGFNLQFTRTPCIWYKPDKTTDQNRYPEKQLIEAYEPFYLLRKGDPVFYDKFTHNVFEFPRVPRSQLVHPTEKPLDLCTALVKLLTVPGELVIDPTAGSASFLDAALRSSRKVQGCELSPRYHERGMIRLAEYLKTFSAS